MFTLESLHSIIVYFRFICDTQGLPTERMLNNGLKAAKFFNRNQNGSFPLWQIKTPREYLRQYGEWPKDTRKHIFNCVEDIIQLNFPFLATRDRLAENADRKQFIDLVKRLLLLDQVMTLFIRYGVFV